MGSNPAVTYLSASVSSSEARDNNSIYFYKMLRLKKENIKKALRTMIHHYETYFGSSLLYDKLEIYPW